MYYHQVIAPTIALGERAFLGVGEEHKMRALDVPLTVRSIAGMFFGLLILQLLGDEEIAKRWEELPEVVASLLFDGLLHNKEIFDK